MTSFKLDLRRFERQPQSNQISITFTPSMELIFETLGTADIDRNPPNSIIEPIVDSNFGNTLEHQNGPNQCQHTNKNTSNQYQHSTTRKQYHHRNTRQQHQHRNPSQQYKPRSFQGHRISSIPYLNFFVLDVYSTRKVCERAVNAT